MGSQNFAAESERAVHNSHPEQEEEEGEGGDGGDGQWRPENIETLFGTTDDIVHLRNGKKYYFFKLPHKVLYIQLSLGNTHCVFVLGRE